MRITTMALLAYCLAGCAGPTVEEADQPQISSSQSAIHYEGAIRTLAPLRLLTAQDTPLHAALGLRSDHGNLKLIVEVNRATEIQGITFIIDGAYEMLGTDPSKTSYRLTEKEYDFSNSLVPLPRVFLRQIAASKDVRVIVHTHSGDFTGVLVADERSPAMNGFVEWLK